MVSKGLPILTKVVKMGTLFGKIGLIGGGSVWRIHELAMMRKKREIEEKIQRIGRVKRQAIAIGATLLGGYVLNNECCLLYTSPSPRD